MEFNKKYVTLKNGKDCCLRSPNVIDAKSTLVHIKITSAETNFMARYPEEIIATEDGQAKLLENKLKDDKSLFICAEVEDKIIGIGSIGCVKNHLKYLHRACFGISIQKEYWNLGIGSHILGELIVKAKEMGFEQLELSVVCNNSRGFELYKKFGFKEYGVIPHAFKYKDSTYADEYLMLLTL